MPALQARCTCGTERCSSCALRTTFLLRFSTPFGRFQKGKGKAGLAFERNESVNTCNLKTDQAEAVRPGARAVDANAAVAIPAHDAHGDVRAVVGIAFAAGERHIEPTELERLSQLVQKSCRPDLGS